MERCKRLKIVSGYLLELAGLSVGYPAPSGGITTVIRSLDLQIAAGEVVGLLGASGSGKTTVGLAILGLLPPGTAVSGVIRFESTDVNRATDRELRQVRGGRIGIIRQEPKAAMHPMIRAGQQVAEVLHAHRPWDWKRCRAEAEALLNRLGLDRRMARAFPHQLSGGQLQRVAIAQAVACGPALVIADEPTAALDTITQAEILKVLQSAYDGSRPAMLFITHQPALLQDFADRVCVLESGTIVESGPASAILASPQHPYTRELMKLASMPPSGTAGAGAVHGV